MTQEIEHAPLSTGTLMYMQDFNGILRDLRRTIEEIRERDRNDEAKMTLAVELRNREHLKWWKVRFDLPRVMAVDFWITSLLSNTTVIAVPDHRLEELTKLAVGECEAAGTGLCYDATTAFSLAEVRARLIPWSLICDQVLDVDGVYLEALHDVKRVVLYDKQPNDNLLNALSPWSRRGNCIPELVIIN